MSKILHFDQEIDEIYDEFIREMDALKPKLNSFLACSESDLGFTLKPWNEEMAAALIEDYTSQMKLSEKCSAKIEEVTRIREAKLNESTPKGRRGRPATRDVSEEIAVNVLYRYYNRHTRTLLMKEFGLTQYVINRIIYRDSQYRKYRDLLTLGTTYNHLLKPLDYVFTNEK